MKSVVLLLIILFDLCTVTVVADLTVKPSNAVSLVGQSAFFNCSTDRPQEIQWYHYPVGKQDSELVYGYGETKGIYVGRFHVQPNTETGAYNLAISPIIEGDAGKYECYDDGGHGNRSHAELTVLAAQPECTTNISGQSSLIIGPNSCGLEPDVIQFSCDVRYYGNVAATPIFEWRRSGDRNVITEGVTTDSSPGQVNSKLMQKADADTVDHSFYCQTKNPTTGSQYRCTSDVVKVWHGFNNVPLSKATVGVSVDCATATEQFMCSFKWTRVNETGETLVSNKQSMTPSAAGLYRCQVNCVIKEMKCPVSAMLVQVTPSGEPEKVTDTTVSVVESESYKAAFIAFVIISVLSVIAIVGLLIYTLRSRRSKQTKKDLLLKKDRDFNELQGKVLNQENQIKEKDARIKELEKALAPVEWKWKLHYLRTIKTTASTKSDKSIKGLALLNNEIFIVSQTESVVEVYNAKTFEPVRRWELKELTKPDDATACDRNKCLYIVNGDKDGHEILKVDSSGKLIKKWATETTGNESGRLSVTKESNVLFAIYNTSTLKEFSPEGELRHVTALTDLGVIHPWHALKLKDGIFLVSHGSTADRVNRLCEVDARPDTKQQVTKIFGAERGTNGMQLSNPSCLAIDKTGKILLADSGNCRVILLGSNFKFERDLVSKKDGVAVPTRIVLDEVNGNLLIGDYKKGDRSLLIFGIE